MSRYRPPVVVVGAGPAGLACADALRRAGRRVVVLEGRGVAASWRSRHDRLRLNSDRRTSSLPGRPMPRRFGRWVGRDDFVAYLCDVARTLDVREGIAVRRLDREGAAWSVRTAEGDVPAAAVVVATGHDRVPVVPPWPGAEAWAGRLLHAAAYRRAGDVAGRRVLVAGAGTSGLEIAVDLARRDGPPVELAVRSAPTTFPREWRGLPLTPAARLAARLPTTVADRVLAVGHRLTMGDLAPYGLAPATGVASRLRATGHGLAVVDGLPALLRAGRIRVVAAVARLEPDAVVLADGTRREPDIVVAATGYRCGLEPLVGHLGVLDPRGRPARTLPGLAFAGFALPVSGQLSALPRTARRVVRDLDPDARPPGRHPRAPRRRTAYVRARFARAARPDPPAR